MSKKIFYIHHGSVIGGAPTSLKYTVKSIIEERPDWQLSIYCAYKSMISFFSDIKYAEIKELPHTCTIIGRLLIGYASLLNVKIIAKVLREILILPISIYQQYQLFKKAQPDIIHLNSAVLTFTAIAAKMAKVKLVWHVREMLSGNKLKKLLAGAIIKKLADEVICISEIEAMNFGKGKSNINIVYNFIDFSKFSSRNIDIEKEKRSYNLLKNDRVIISLGGAAHRKGTIQLIEAMEYLSKDYKLIIAGPPYQKESNLALKAIKDIKLLIENLLVKLKVKKIFVVEYSYRVSEMLEKNKNRNIIFAGILTNIIPLLAISDVLVFAGTTPHFPRPIFEAWAMKKPVIVFKMDGISNQVNHLVDGIIVEKIGGQDLAEGIKLMFASKEKMIKMGISGFEKSLKKFNSKLNTAKILSIYESL